MKPKHPTIVVPPSIGTLMELSILICSQDANTIELVAHDEGAGCYLTIEGKISFDSDKEIDDFATVMKAALAIGKANQQKPSPSASINKN